MKKITLILAIPFLFITSCGTSAEDKKKVCTCETLFQTMKDREGDYQIEENITSNEAQQKVETEFKAEYDICTKLNKDLGEDAYLKASQECKTK